MNILKCLWIKLLILLLFFGNIHVVNFFVTFFKTVAGSEGVWCSSRPTAVTILVLKLTENIEDISEQYNKINTYQISRL